MERIKRFCDGVMDKLEIYLDKYMSVIVVLGFLPLVGGLIGLAILHVIVRIVLGMTR